MEGGGRGSEGWGGEADVQGEGEEKARTGRAAGLLLAEGQSHGLRLDRENVVALI